MWNRIIWLVSILVVSVAACSTERGAPTSLDDLVGLSPAQVQLLTPSDEAFIVYDLSEAILGVEETYTVDQASNFVVLAACQEPGGFAVVAVPDTLGRPLVEDALEGKYMHLLHCSDGDS